MTSQTHIIREFTKSRLIAALVSEIDAASAMVVAHSATTGKTFHGTLQCQFKIPFQESLIVLDIGDDASQSLTCTCCYGGKRFLFDLERGDDGHWKLPNMVRIAEYRSDIRRAFADRLYSAELVTERGAVYGYAVDVNCDFLAVDVDGGHHLREGDAVKVIIRMVSSNVDVFYNDSDLVQVKVDAAQGCQRLIFRRALRTDENSKQRRDARRPVEAAELQITKSPFADDAGAFSLPVVNVSAGGMTVRRRRGTAHPSLIPGLILQAVNPSLSFMVVWMKDDTIGLRPILSEPRLLAEWHRYLDRVAPPEDQKLGITRRELTDLLTQSGLLKGHRRKHLGIRARDHVIASAASESPLLIQRAILTDRHGNADIHVSLKRISEYSWFFGEGAGLSETGGDYNALLDACTYKMVSMSRQSPLYCRYVTAIWHYSVKSSVTWGETIGSLKGSLMRDALQASIASFREQRPRPAVSQKVRFVTELTAEERRTMSLHFHAQLYECIVGLDGTHPILNGELGRFGPYHRVMTKMTVSASGVPLVAHRILTHNVWNSTGVTNSVFVLVPNGILKEELASGLRAISEDDLSYGTDDFLMIFDGPLNASEALKEVLVAPKRFSFLVHDLFLNEPLRFKDDEQSRLKRVSGS